MVTNRRDETAGNLVQFNLTHAAGLLNRSLKFNFLSPVTEHSPFQLKLFC